MTQIMVFFFSLNFDIHDNLDISDTLGSLNYLDIFDCFDNLDIHDNLDIYDSLDSLDYFDIFDSINILGILDSFDSQNFKILNVFTFGFISGQ